MREAPHGRFVTDFAQIAGVLGGFDLDWPDSLATFLGLCGILDFDIDVTGPECIVRWTWAHNMILQLSLPLVVGLINVLQYGVLSVFRPAQSLEIAKHRRAQVISKYLAFVNCLYMTLVRYTVGAFICMDLTDSKRLRVLTADPNIDCDSGDHTSLMIVAGVGLVLYTIGFPVVAVWALSMVDKRQEHNSVLRLRQFGDLYDR